jgi:hypothetical protein
MSRDGNGHADILLTLVLRPDDAADVRRLRALLKRLLRSFGLLCVRIEQEDRSAEDTTREPSEPG